MGCPAISVGDEKHLRFEAEIEVSDKENEILGRVREKIELRLHLIGTTNWSVCLEKETMFPIPTYPSVQGRPHNLFSPGLIT